MKLIISSHLTPFLLVIFILLKTYSMTQLNWCYSDSNAILLSDFGNVNLFTLFDFENQKINPLNFFMIFISKLSVCSSLINDC